MRLLNHNISFHRRTDLLLIWTLRSAAFLTGSTVLLIIAFLLIGSIPALKEIGISPLLNDSSWHPMSGLYNMAPMAVASVVVCIGGTTLAIIPGLGAAIFTVFYAPPRVAGIFKRVVELMAGIPSVVFGFWGLVVLVPIVKHSILAAIIILAIMIMPTIALITTTTLQEVPKQFRNGADALGLSKWSVIFKVIIPLAGRGISSAILLAAARAIGETIAVLMVSGNIVQFPGSLIEPVRALTSNIALEMSYASGTHHSVLFISGLFLMLIVVILVIITEKLKTPEVRHES